MRTVRTEYVNMVTVSIFAAVSSQPGVTPCPLLYLSTQSAVAVGNLGYPDFLFRCGNLYLALLINRNIDTH